jgi:Outer membrane protein beta-barrel domain
MIRQLLVTTMCVLAHTNNQCLEEYYLFDDIPHFLQPFGENKMIELFVKVVLLSLLLLIPINAQTKHKDKSKNDEAFQNQTEDKLQKFEIEAHFTFLNTTDNSVFRRLDPILRGGFLGGQPIEIPATSSREPGFGARISYNINKHIAIEAEANWLPRFYNFDKPGTSSSTEGTKQQVFVGAKIGKRLKLGDKHFGVFGKIRPGAIRFDGFGRNKPNQSTSSFGFITDFRNATFFNIDVGGVIEYYVTKRTFIRADFGDTIIYYGKPNDSIKTFLNKPINPTFTTHNFQTSVGFGFRF